MCLFHSSAPGNWKDTEIGPYLTLKRLLDTRYFFRSRSRLYAGVVSSQIHSNRKNELCDSEPKKGKQNNLPIECMTSVWESECRADTFGPSNQTIFI